MTTSYESPLFLVGSLLPYETCTWIPDQVRNDCPSSAAGGLRRADMQGVHEGAQPLRNNSSPSLLKNTRREGVRG